MASEEHLAKLREGVEAWNAWREENRDVKPNLSDAKLWTANLSGADLSDAKLRGADLSEAVLPTESASCQDSPESVYDVLQT